jgi:hypothetical protein
MMTEISVGDVSSRRKLPFVALRFSTFIAFMLCVSGVVVAHADNDTFTQVGSFQIQMTSNGAQVPTFNWQGPSVVTFPLEFGSSPQVILSFGTVTPLGGGVRLPAFLTITPQNITPTGFTPVISAQGSANLAPVTINWVAVGSRLYKGTAIPKYAILTVIYAPPGTNGGHATSSVSYGSGVTTGTTTSASQSFQSSIGVSVTAQGGILGSGGAGSLSFDYTSKTTDTQSLEIKQSNTSTITRPGPAQDGIQHDEDAIYLLLKPTISVSLSSSAAAWTFGDNSQSPIQYVFVGELNGHFPWRAGVLQQLNAAGVTASDYATILASDPLATQSSTVDPSRFVAANTMFPYEPPATPNDPVIPITTTISSSSTSTTGLTTQETYKVGLSLSGTAGFLDVVNSTMKNTATWTWTNTSSSSTSSGTTQSASLTIGGPAYGYAGATEVAVYTDTVYNTFAFVLVPAGSIEVGVKGTLKTAAGAPIPSAEVVLTENGVNHRTFTNARGEYIFFGHIRSPATVRASGITQAAPQADSPRSLNFQLH